MTNETQTQTQTPAAEGPPSAPATTGPKHSRLAAFSFRNISAIYIGIVVVIGFSIALPDTFATDSTLRAVLNEQAIAAMLAIGLVIPLAANGIDLSIGSTLGLGVIFVAWLIGLQDMATVPAIILTLAACATVGVVNGFLVTVARIDSFIATLAMSSVVGAMIVWISNNQQIIGLSRGFTEIASTEFLGVTLPFYYMLIVATGAWYVLEHTPIGRYLYATGGGIEAARLAGLPTKRLLFGAFVACSTIAGLAGLLATAQVGAGSPEIGHTYLLAAFAAAFLGSTQLKRGRVNVWGTVIAVYVLAIGVKGLQLAGAPFWVSELFNGLALIVAVAAAVHEGRVSRTGRLKRRRKQAAAA